MGVKGLKSGLHHAAASDGLVYDFQFLNMADVISEISDNIA